MSTKDVAQHQVKMEVRGQRLSRLKKYKQVKEKRKIQKQKRHKVDEDEKRMKIFQYDMTTLGAGDLQQAVLTPKGEDFNEWLAANTVDFFQEISLLYGIITEYCTKDSCPVMCAGPCYEYLWMDGVKYKKPHKCSAPEYIDILLSYVEEKINDERIFPTEKSKKFPKQFKDIVKTMLKRLFRIYGHMYLHHVEKFVQLGAMAHLNTCFKYFMYFVKQHKLILEIELVPLNHIINELLKNGKKYKPKYKY